MDDECSICNTNGVKFYCSNTLKRHRCDVVICKNCYKKNCLKYCYNCNGDMYKLPNINDVEYSEYK